ncbi:MAG TPA: GH1 family beta-glucosidase [Clostridia bacterium]
MRNFLWGVSTAAYQIEGAFDEDGKGLSIWDVFTKQPGKIYHDHNGDRACGHYYHLESDIELIKELGVNAYRFSISWPRVLPEGIGKANQKGLDFYKKLVDLLLKADITPFVTLYHWDMPYELHLKGGLLNNDFSNWFSEYAETILKTFKGKVKFFSTFNEPQCVIGLGYGAGLFAPGYKLPKSEISRCVHNLLLSHGKAVKIIKDYDSSAQAGIVTCGAAFYPVDNAQSNIDIVPLAYQSQYDENSILLYTDPIMFGKYPAQCYKENPDLYDNINPDDLKIISTPIDYLGINNYEGVPVEADGDGFKVAQRPWGYPKTDFDWAVEEESIYWISKYLYERYKKPIYITENGIANNDWIHLDGRVHDAQRIDYLERYIGKVKQAISDGVDIRGYFVWSLMDNFEWANGYSKRFGLVHIDYTTLKRTPKDSYYWYKEYIKSNL